MQWKEKWGRGGERKNNRGQKEADKVLHSTKDKWPQCSGFHSCKLQRAFFILMKNAFSYFSVFTLIFPKTGYFFSWCTIRVQTNIYINGHQRFISWSVSGINHCWAWYSTLLYNNNAQNLIWMLIRFIARLCTKDECVLLCLSPPPYDNAWFPVEQKETSRQWTKTGVWGERRNSF